MKKLVFALLLCGSLLAVAAVISPPGEIMNREYDYNGLEKIHIENGAGKTSVVPMERPRVVISAERIKGDPETCKFTAERSEFSEVLVRVEKPIAKECVINLTVQVPKEIDISVWSGSGDVSVTGIEGVLTVNTGSGSLKADGKILKLDAKTSSGNVDVAGLTGDGKVAASSGAVNLKLLEDPRGKLDVKTSSGHATISLPRGSKINASLDTSSGKLLNELDNRSDANFGISAASGSGDLRVRTY